MTTGVGTWKYFVLGRVCSECVAFGSIGRVIIIILTRHVRVHCWHNVVGIEETSSGLRHWCKMRAGCWHGTFFDIAAVHMRGFGVLQCGAFVVVITGIWQVGESVIGLAFGECMRERV